MDRTSEWPRTISERNPHSKFQDTLRGGDHRCCARAHLHSGRPLARAGDRDRHQFCRRRRRYGRPDRLASHYAPFYYANPDSTGMLTVYYTGASAGDIVDLDDEQLGGAGVPLGAASTADGNGAGSFTFPSSEVNQNGDLIELTDVTANNATSDQFALEFQPQPQANDDGPVIDGSGHPLTDSEIVEVSGAVPDEPVELTVNSTVDAFTANADDSGDASFNLTGLTAGYNTVQAVSEDSGGTPADEHDVRLQHLPGRRRRGLERRLDLCQHGETDADPGRGCARRHRDQRLRE